MTMLSQCPKIYFNSSSEKCEFCCGICFAEMKKTSALCLKVCADNAQQILMQDTDQLCFTPKAVAVLIGVVLVAFVLLVFVLLKRRARELNADHLAIPRDEHGLVTPTPESQEGREGPEELVLSTSRLGGVDN
ncbi:uncharacterized protein LOC143290875 [Babylonia areolata]|uniref:uncharacterized protein LOC143290875 n=1 Tax=Babylonia areolata TaxID=304850 RepID=UPI003FCFC5D8